MMDDYLPPHRYKNTSKENSASILKPDHQVASNPPGAISIDDILDVIESAKYYAIRLPVKICNVVCNVKLSERVDLATLGAKAPNSKVLKNMVIVRLHEPKVTACVRSTGMVTCMGAVDTARARLAADNVVRYLTALGFRTRMETFEVTNVLGSCRFPFAIRLEAFAKRHKEAKYEPELQCSVVYKIGDPKATFVIFSTGTVNVFASSMYNVYVAFRRISPLLCEIADDNFRRIKFEVGIFETK